LKFKKPIQVLMLMVGLQQSETPHQNRSIVSSGQNTFSTSSLEKLIPMKMSLLILLIRKQWALQELQPGKVKQMKVEM